jgi:hypothetical protein
MEIEKIEKLIGSYLEVSLQVKELELLKSSISSQIEESFNDNDLKSFDFNGHRITRAFRRRYHYPPNIQALENDLKDAKKRFEIDSQDYDLVTYITAKFTK